MTGNDLRLVRKRAKLTIVQVSRKMRPKVSAQRVGFVESQIDEPVTAEFERRYREAVAAAVAESDGATL